MISSKQEDHIKKKTAIEKLRAGISSSIKSENMYPFRFSIASKKKGRLVRIPAKTAIPTQNFHLMRVFSMHQTILSLKRKAQSLKPFLKYFFLLKLPYMLNLNPSKMLIYLKN